MNLLELRMDCAVKQKRGLHFIVASILIWGLVLAIQMTDLPVLSKNMLTFCMTTLLLPLAFAISKGLRVDFQNKGNPLNKLGIMFSVNQMPYILIAMWVYQAVPEKMLMVVAMIFGAHLMPFGWLYMSNTYLVLSGLIPLAALIVGLNCPATDLAIVMIFIEILFCVGLVLENNRKEEKV